jgi:hypothetical protein
VPKAKEEEAPALGATEAAEGEQGAQAKKGAEEQAKKEAEEQQAPFVKEKRGDAADFS